MAVVSEPALRFASMTARTSRSEKESGFFSRRLNELWRKSVWAEFFLLFALSDELEGSGDEGASLAEEEQRDGVLGEENVDEWHLTDLRMRTPLVWIARLNRHLIVRTYQCPVLDGPLQSFNAFIYVPAFSHKADVAAPCNCRDDIKGI